MSSNCTDKELAGLVAGGQKDYFAEIMARFEHRILSIVRKYLHGAFEREADDLMQEIWIKLFKALEKYDPDLSALGTFIYRIAENRCLDFLRSKWTKRTNETIFDADIPEHYEDDESGAGNRPSGEYQVDPVKYYAVKKAMKNMFSKIDGLPEPLRNLLVLRFVANVSEKEIADERGSSVRAVRSNITRASQMLVDALQDLSNPEEVAKILCKGSFVFTEKEVKRIKDVRVRKFLEFINVKRAPMEKIFKTLGCSTKEERQSLLDRVVNEILKFQRMRFVKKLPPEKLVGALFAEARKMMEGADVATGASSPGSEILLAAKEKEINMDKLKALLDVTDSELIKLTSDRLAVSSIPGLPAKIKKRLGIPICRLRAARGAAAMLSLRDRESEDEFLGRVRVKVLRKLGIKQV